MVEESRLDILQDEIKLLKAEVKNSLASVRDYLLNMELPSSEFSTILAALAGDNAEPQKMDVDSHVDNDKLGGMPEPEKIDDNLVNEAEPGEYEEMLDFEEGDNKTDEYPEEKPDDGMFEENQPPESMKAAGDLPDEFDEDEEDNSPEEELPPEDELDEEEADDNTEDENEELPEEEPELPLEEVQPMEYNQPVSEEARGIPKVNMLANLINWVAKARQEIGSEQLPALLEVYGTSGHLSPEMKDIILHLAEIVNDYSEVANEPEIWSQSILSLHGVLTGGDAPLNPVIPSWVDISDEAEALSDEEIIEVDKNKEKSAKLKLVFPGGNGKSKEFCINLTPEENVDS
ncbi:MAG: hypothetical protein JW845_02995 [Dehalococcoidales bacterium]|nr:hypothetical protein [Dehalococcoidales bacterium]